MLLCYCVVSYPIYTYLINKYILLFYFNNVVLYKIHKSACKLDICTKDVWCNNLQCAKYCYRRDNYKVCS